MRRAAAMSLIPTLLLLGAAPASADPDVGLSRDGVSWSASLPDPLFDPDFRWVPGDQQVKTFYVRNESDDDARLSVDVLGSSIDSLIDTGDLEVSARGDGGAWRDVSTAGTHRLVSGVEVGGGQVSRVDVGVAFAPSSANQSQTRRLELDFRVRLVQTGTDVPGDVPGDDGGLLPDTGAPSFWALVLSVGLIGGGAVLTSRRQQKEDSHVQS